MPALPMFVPGCPHDIHIRKNPNLRALFPKTTTLEIFVLQMMLEYVAA